MTDTAAVSGRTLGHYVVQRELGRGGMAVVYLAHDTQHGRDVAVKVMRAEVASAVGVERFLQEIRIESALQHPHILPLHDSGMFDGLPYYVMPYVAGETLRVRLDRERQLPVPVALRIAQQIASALGYAHRQGIVHRDIKPENVLLSGNDALVADFGIARAVSLAGAERLTDTGIAVGTPAYMSPEQCGGGSIDGRSDLYALGCVLYEMLAGQPPFSGRTAQAIVARHMQELPPAITVVRPMVPAATVRALDIALAKVPADRYQTAEQFIEALEPSAETSAKIHAERRPMLRRWVALAVGALATAVLLVWLALPRSPPLDPNRVMVFPLRDAGQPGGAVAGEDVATYIGHVLDGSEPLRWDEGRDWLTAEQRADPGRLAPADVRGISRSHGARFYIDGSIVRGADSTTVILRLFDAAADSLLKRAGRSGPSTSSEAQLGALAVGDLLPSLLESGRRVDVGALRERRPAAIANFLQGEREYREGRFEEALRHYQVAVEEDSLFALAAVKGAFAGTWGEDLDEVARLAGIAIRGDAALPARYTHFARGLRHYVPGSADSAVAEFQHAIRLAPDWEEAWMALGDVYRHLLPGAVGLDSLAEDAFRKARSLDPEFTPPLYHLFEAAIRGDRLEEATRLLDTLGRSPLDSALGRVASLLLRCARGEMRDGDWTAAAAAPGEVLNATQTLSTAVSHRRCAEVGLRAVIASDSASPAHRFNALFGLQSLLVQQRRYGEVRELLRSPAAAPLGGPFFFLNDAFADPAFVVDAREIVRQQGSDYPGMSPVKLWLLGTWEAYHGTRDALAAVEKSLWWKADSSGQARDSTLARIVAGHAAVAAGDTNLAMERLSALKPGGTSQDISWSLWSSMGLERLMLARLLLNRGEYAEAIRVASIFDSPEPTLYLLFVAPSLALRAQAAQALGDDGLASRYRARLAVLINPKP